MEKGKKDLNSKPLNLVTVQYLSDGDHSDFMPNIQIIDSNFFKKKDIQIDRLLNTTI